MQSANYFFLDRLDVGRDEEIPLFFRTLPSLSLSFAAALLITCNDKHIFVMDTVEYLC